MGRVRLGVDAFWHFRHHFIAVALLLSSILVSLVIAGPATSKTTARGFSIMNYSGSTIELYWVHVSDRPIPLGISGAVNALWIDSYIILVSHFFYFL
jgi:hypothetical protein